MVTPFPSPPGGAVGGAAPSIGVLMAERTPGTVTHGRVTREPNLRRENAREPSADSSAVERMNVMAGWLLSVPAYQARLPHGGVV